MSWKPNWPRPDEVLQALMQRPGEIPTPGNDRWGKSQLLTVAQPSYTFANVGYRGGTPTPMAIQMSFSLDGIIYTPQIPSTYAGSITIGLIKAVDVKAGSFREDTVLTGGQALPFCTLITNGITVNIGLNGEGAAVPLFVHCVICPAETVDCASVTSPPDSPWNDVQTASFPADTVGAFLALDASTGTKQLFIQNNSAVDLLIGFGSVTPDLGPPPVSNLILPGGLHSVWESQLGAFTGKVRAIFAAGGLSTEYATFTRGISA